MIQVVAPGPGSIRTMSDPNAEWEPATVALFVEYMGPNEGTDTIAVLDLEGESIHAPEAESLSGRIQIELTFGDIVDLREKLSRIIEIDRGPVVNGEQFARGYTHEAAEYEQRTRT